MIYNIDIAKQIAKSLLQIKAIILQPDNPFQWASGWYSPIYCDNRKTLAYPKIRNYIRQSLVTTIRNHFKGANVIAGVATAGIPHGVLVAEELGLPFIYVRSQAKEHGKQNKIEGEFEKGASIVLIEDLISSGKSSIEAASTLDNAGANIKGVVSIFTYGLDSANKNFRNTNYSYISLCDYNTLLKEAITSQYIQDSDLSILEKWREAPSQWEVK